MCALGLGEQLVGRSHECDFPPGLESLPVLTRSRVRVDGLSGETDRDVRRLLEDALAVYEVDVEALERADPSAVVTQDLCDVCAVSLSDVRDALQQLGRGDVALINLHPTRLNEVWDDVRRVGQALGHSERGERVAAELAGRIAALTERTAQLPRASVLTIEWLDPVMVGGTWMPELVTAAGGEALVTEPGQHAPTLTRGDLAGLRPDLVLIKPCGFPLAQTRRELSAFLEGLSGLEWPALNTGRVYVADGNAYFNRPGPRLVESAEILAACLHPEACADLAERHAGAFERVQVPRP